MVVKLQQTKKDPSIVRHDLTTTTFERESKEEVTELSAAVSEVTVCSFFFFFFCMLICKFNN